MPDCVLYYLLFRLLTNPMSNSLICRTFYQIGLVIVYWLLSLSLPLFIVPPKIVPKLPHPQILSWNDERKFRYPKKSPNGLLSHVFQECISPLYVYSFFLLGLIRFLALTIRFPREFSPTPSISFCPRLIGKHLVDIFPV